MGRKITTLDARRHETWIEKTARMMEEHSKEIDELIASGAMTTATKALTVEEIEADTVEFSAEEIEEAIAIRTLAMQALPRAKPEK